MFSFSIALGWSLVFVAAVIVAVAAVAFFVFVMLLLHFSTSIRFSKCNLESEEQILVFTHLILLLQNESTKKGKKSTVDGFFVCSQLIFVFLLFLFLFFNAPVCQLISHSWTNKYWNLWAKKATTVGDRRCWLQTTATMNLSGSYFLLAMKYEPTRMARE